MNAMPVPSTRLLLWATGLAAAALVVLAVPILAPVLLAASILLAGVAVLDLLLTPRPAALMLERHAPIRASLLGKHQVTIRVRNQSQASLAVRIRDEAAPELRADIVELSVVAPAGGMIETAYLIHPASRGKFTWGTMFLRYRSVLGLWERSKLTPSPAEVRVYPAVEQVERYHLLARTDRLPSLGIRRIRQRGAAWEFESLREFANGDDTRLIDWKASARWQKLITRNQQAERNQTILVLVDSGRLMAAEEQGVSKLDHAVNAALLLGHVGLSRGDRVGLCGFAAAVHTWVAPRPRVVQMRLLTEALFDLRAELRESDHARCLREVALRHNKRALLVLLTDFVDAETAAEMMAAVRHAARRHVVLFVALKDPFLDRAAQCRPMNETEGFRKAVALGLLRERREVLESMRQSGAHVVDALPSHVTPHVINKYLEIAFKGLL